MAVNEIVKIKGATFIIKAECEIAGKRDEPDMVTLLQSAAFSVVAYIVVRNGFIQLFENSTNSTTDLQAARALFIAAVVSIDL